MSTGPEVPEVDPAEAFRVLAEQPEAVLLDVRSAAEWTFVGLPDASAMKGTLATVEWQSFPGMVRHPAFLEAVRAADVTPGRPVYCLCRSGVRSLHAAALLIDAGYAAFNISEGFEGPLDTEGHRAVSGWKVRGLPWKQG